MVPSAFSTLFTFCVFWMKFTICYDQFLSSSVYFILLFMVSLNANLCISQFLLPTQVQELSRKSAAIYPVHVEFITIISPLIIVLCQRQNNKSSRQNIPGAPEIVHSNNFSRQQLGVCTRQNCQLLAVIESADHKFLLLRIFMAEGKPALEGSLHSWYCHTVNIHAFRQVSSHKSKFQLVGIH